MLRSSLAFLALSISMAIVGCSGDDGSDSPTPTTACSDYCTDIMATCTGDNAQYASNDECLSSCSGFSTAGADGDTSGDTLQCRVYHAGAAESDPATHCSHAGPTGGGVCVSAARTY